MSQNLEKIVRLGNMPAPDQKHGIYCKIQFIDGRLSITGVEGPQHNGNCVGSCGQIGISLNTPEGISNITPAPGWNHEGIAKFLDTWQRWHLNDMRPGTPAQMAYLRGVIYPGYGNGEDHFTWAQKELRAAGLQPDKGYSYGSQWLREDVPDEVIEYLRGLPETDRQPAWV